MIVSGASVINRLAGSAPAAVAPPPSLPAWVEALSVWEWGQIANTALSSVQPNPVPTGGTANTEAKITAWCGAGLKRAGSVYLIGAAGGHGDYAGNEVDALTLNTAAPAWVELRGPTYAPNIYNLSQFYGDNRAAATHHYWSTQFIEARNRLMIFNSDGMESEDLPATPGGWPYDVGTDPGWVKSFSLASNDWDAPDTFENHRSGTSDGPALTVFQNFNTGDVYAGSGGWRKWTQATATWSTLAGGGLTDYAGAAVDFTRSRALLVGSSPGTTPPRLVDLTDGSESQPSFGGLGAGELTVGGYPGVVYDELNDTYLVLFNSGGSIETRRVTAGALVVDNPVGGSKPAARPNGIHTSVQWVPELRGIVIANSYTGNVWFMRTSL